MNILLPKKSLLFFGGFCVVSVFLLKSDINLNSLNVPFKLCFNKKKWDNFIAEESRIQFGHKVTSRSLIVKFEELYQKYNLSRIKINSDFNIPNVIHMIWLGGKLPMKFAKFREGWLKYHPSWIHILWTDHPAVNDGKIINDLNVLEEYLANIDDIKENFLVADIKIFPLIQKTFFNRLENVGAKTSLLRYEILYRFGGLYVDTDMECLKAFDILHKSYDFFAGCFMRGWFGINNAVIACRPGHEILKNCVYDIGKYSKKYPHSAYVGPIHITKVIENYNKLFEERNIIFPQTFFYPESLNAKNARPETFGIHHWATSWHKCETKNMKFKFN